MTRYVAVTPAFGVSAPHTTSMNAGASTLDVRVCAALSSWTPSGVFGGLMGCWGNPTPGGKEFWLRVDAGGTGLLGLEWFDNTATARSATSTAVTGLAANAVKWVRALLTTTAGTCDFYMSDNGTTWTALGTQVTGLSTNPIQVAGTPPEMHVGSDSVNTNEVTGNLYQATLIIGGTTVCDINFNDYAVGTHDTTLTAITGETWTLLAGAIIAGVEDPFYGRMNPRHIGPYAAGFGR